jgi:hypothetical protein
MMAEHENPVPLVHVKALPTTLQLGTASAVGLAVDADPLPRMVLAVCVARSEIVTRPFAVRLPVIVGAAMVGDVARTAPPEPVTAFPKAVATPVPRPEIPVDAGRPVAFVNVADEGVPSAGETSVGELDRTADPVPVAEVEPVPPLAAVNGFCSVKLLKVGDGYVWASAVSGNMSAAIRIFFIWL